MNALYHRIYLCGNDGKIMPRWLRKILAGSEFHRAWMLGFKGFFVESGVRYGPANPYGANRFT